MTQYRSLQQSRNNKNGNKSHVSSVRNGRRLHAHCRHTIQHGQEPWLHAFVSLDSDTTWLCAGDQFRYIDRRALHSEEVTDRNWPEGNGRLRLKADFKETDTL